MGIVASQPKQKGGVLFGDSADKAARFIQTCNAFNIPLLFLADVPGFMIGTQVERQGIIRHGAKMISAVSEATVPKISVIVRKAYGAGLYAMAGPAFEPDCCLALPGAQVAVMGPQAAINAVYHNQLAAIDDETERARRTEELREGMRATSTSCTWPQSSSSTRSSRPTTCARSSSGVSRTRPRAIAHGPPSATRSRLSGGRAGRHRRMRGLDQATVGGGLESPAERVCSSWKGG